jgi:hypothetical protein
MKVAKYLGSTRRSEQLLAEAFLRVATKHEQEADIRDVGRLLAAWSREHIEHLSLLGERYGEDENEPATLMGRNLITCTSENGDALLRDLESLWLLTQSVKINWLILHQTAQALGDTQFEGLSAGCCKAAERQVKWIETQIKNAAAQALLAT